MKDIAINKITNFQQISVRYLLPTAIFLSTLIHGALFYFSSDKTLINNSSTLQLNKANKVKVNFKQNIISNHIDEEITQNAELSTSSRNEDTNELNKKQTFEPIVKTEHTNVNDNTNIKALKTSKNVNQVFKDIPSNNQTNSAKRDISISSNTTDYKYSQYYNDWKAKIERVGAMNYPSSVKEASLILKVVISSDGNLIEFNIVKSSGNPVVDESAINTVKMAAPFAKFPDSIKNEVDTINITKTWKYLNNQVTTS